MALLDSHFALAGSWIVAMSVLVAGMLLCTDYLMWRLAAGATGVTVASGAGLWRMGRRSVDRSQDAGTQSLGAEEDEAEYEYEYEEEDADAEEEGEAGEYEYEYEYEEDDEEADDVWDEDEEGADEEGDALTIRTPASKSDASESTPAADDETSAAEGLIDEAQDEALVGPAALAAGAAAVAGGLKGKLTSALGIKKPAEAAVEEPESAAPPIKKPSAQAAKQAARDEIMTQLEEAESRGVEDFDYALPPLDLLLPADDVSYEEHEREVRRKARVLEKTFRNFGFNVKVVEIETGPVIAQYEVQLEAGLRLSKITGLADDLAIALRVPSVRIVAPIPGKNTVGIEVPNEHRQLVRLRQVIEETNGQAKRMKIPIFLGQDVAGNPMAVDLAALPHLLIAGRTGTGKSVCLNSIIVSIIMSRGPDEVRMLMIDPKMVELSGYKKLPHLMHPVVTDMRKAEAILAWAVDKMEERYALLARAGVRHVSVYNQLSEAELRDRVVPESETEWEQIPRNLPFIVIVADEMADLMMTAGKEVEQHIIRLAQKSRAVGIHLILATQKPTVDVITGLIKSNLPARIAFQVASRTDSRVVLDEMGADKLLGNGDMLFLSPGTSMLLRGQGTFLGDDEITKVTDYVATDSPQFARELIELKTKEEEEQSSQSGGKLKNRDEMYEAAVDVVVRERRGSVSLLQRCLGIGYGRAARLIDYMAEDG
ncbi:MAG: DNA translocase FtsK, partial [Planctomycetales bacterium]|nr:DNA translocase FtsK [Planctomycetales bacterium]